MPLKISPIGCLRELNKNDTGRHTGMDGESPKGLNLSFKTKINKKKKLLATKE